jgi:lipopolysaccharide export system permease protein
MANSQPGRHPNEAEPFVSAVSIKTAVGLEEKFRFLGFLRSYDPPPKNCDSAEPTVAATTRPGSALPQSVAPGLDFQNMRILTRYVLWEVLRVFLMTLVMLTVFLTIIGGVRQGMKAGLSPALILQVFPFILPEMLVLTMPGSLLFATATVFGRISASNEMVAVKSLGIHPMRIIWPAIALSATMSLCIWTLFDLNAGWCRPMFNRLVLAAVEEVVYGTLESNRTFQGPGFGIVVREVQERTLIQPVITIRSAGNMPRVSLICAEARIEIADDATAMTLVCRDGEIDVGGTSRLHFEDEFRQVVPFDANLPQGEDPGRPSTIVGSRLPGFQSKARRDIEDFEQQLRDMAPDDPIRPAVENMLDMTRHQHRKLRAEPHNRLAKSMTCFCFALLSIPIALMGRNRDVFTSLMFCILPILGVYYPLLVVGEQGAVAGWLPPYGVWLADLLFAFAGAVLLYRVTRH